MRLFWYTSGSLRYFLLIVLIGRRCFRNTQSKNLGLVKVTHGVEIKKDLRTNVLCPGGLCLKSLLDSAVAAHYFSKRNFCAILSPQLNQNWIKVMMFKANQQLLTAVLGKLGVSFLPAIQAIFHVRLSELFQNLLKKRILQWVICCVICSAGKIYR